MSLLSLFERESFESAANEISPDQQISDHLGKRMLGHWSAPRPCGTTGSPLKARRLGMENPLCASGRLPFPSASMPKLRSEWIWPAPLFLVAFFAPESPWWLVRKGRFEDAKRSLTKLTSKKGKDDFDPDQTIAMMRHTISAEKEVSQARSAHDESVLTIEATAGATYLDCFRGSNLRRTEIVLGCWAVQQLCGSGASSNQVYADRRAEVAAFMNYSTYFFQQAGLRVSSSFDLSMGQYAINTGGTVIAWFLMGSGVGRRTLYLYGTSFMFCFLIIIGGVSTIPGSNAAWASAIMLLCWSVAYQFSVCPPEPHSSCQFLTDYL